MTKEYKEELRDKYEAEVSVPEMIPDPTMVTREMWGALPAKATEPLGPRVRYVVATLFTDTPICITKKSCIKTVKDLQKRHMNQLGLEDIQYNFLIGCDGRVYEGRGWHNKSCSSLEHPEGLPPAGRRLDIAFIGDWREQENPAIEMVDPAVMLLNYGIKKHYVQQAYIYYEIGKKVKGKDK